MDSMYHKTFAREVSEAMVPAVATALVIFSAIMMILSGIIVFFGVMSLLKSAGMEGMEFIALGIGGILSGVLLLAFDTVIRVLHRIEFHLEQGR